MVFVIPKKSLGQHFLKSDEIASKICGSLRFHNSYHQLIEIGPGTGILSKFLFELENISVKLIEVDRESIAFLHEKYPEKKDDILLADFLKIDLKTLIDEPFGVIGNFPYNISSQILFKVFDHRNLVQEVVGMFQKEVAERIVSAPGSKKYGILSVLMQAFYHVEYLFTVNEQEFYPPPKVKSAVIRLTRNETISLTCDEKLFVAIVKQAFNQRRKMLRNALHSFTFSEAVEQSGLLTKRAEQLSYTDFEFLTNQVQL